MIKQTAVFSAIIRLFFLLDNTIDNFDMPDFIKNNKADVER